MNCIGSNCGLLGEIERTLDKHRVSQGGSTLVGVDVPSATEYCHELTRIAGVLLLPGPCLGYGDTHVRFGFGRDTFRAALQHYEAHLQHMQ